ncbi:MAG: hypothetical protein AB7N76_18410 [Planctomycetota bacterium]
MSGAPEEPEPFLGADDLLSSAWALRPRRPRRDPPPPPSDDDDDDDEVLSVSLEELEDVDPLFPRDLRDKARDQLKAWCETVDEDVFVLDLDDDDLDD